MRLWLGVRHSVIILACDCAQVGEPTGFGILVTQAGPDKTDVPETDPQTIKRFFASVARLK